MTQIFSGSCKFVLILVSLSYFAPTMSWSQQSFNFSVPQPVDGKNVWTVDRSYFGIYTSENSEIYYEFDGDGIWSISTNYNFITREAVRESSQYRVRNGYLLGLVENDSVPCILQDEKYYFGIRNRDLVVGLNSKHSMKRISDDEYVVNFFEGNYYTPSSFRFKRNSLTVRHFDYETGTKVFEAVKIQNENIVDDMNIITLTPSAKEWSELEKLGIYGKEVIFFEREIISLWDE